MVNTGFLQFLKAFTKSWFTLMSGPATVPFTIAAVFVSQPWLKALLGALALSCAILSSYLVWCNERLAYIGEREKNGWPDIRGEAFNFHTGSHGDSFDTKSCWTIVSFQMSLCNHRQVLTNLKAIELEGDDMKIPARFSPTNFHSEGHEKPELPRGLNTIINCATRMEVSDHFYDEIRSMDLAGLKIYVVDGFGERHQITVRAGELLKSA